MESKVLVKHLLEHDAKPDLEGTVSLASRSSGRTNLVTIIAISCTCYYSHALGYCLSYQAESALHVAVACDNKEIAELLLTANATIDRKNKVPDLAKPHFTPLHT